MNPTQPDPNAPEPLTADERAWAERLARIGPNGGPPPALDASILAAAHAAASSRHQRQHTTRWPALLGLAATLALAVGVAWQLRPLATAPGVQDEVPSGAPVAATGVKPERADDARASTNASSEAGAVAAESSPAPAGDVGTAAATAPRTRENSGVNPPTSPQAVTTPAPAPAPTATDAAPEPMAFPAPPPPSPPPPAARAAKATAAIQEDAAARPRLDRSATVPQQSATAESVATDATATSNAAAPATATAGMPGVAEDRFLSPADWLQRIRLRRDLGDTAAARDSLALFRQMHPGITVPADLRAFGADPASADE